MVMPRTRKTDVNNAVSESDSDDGATSEIVLSWEWEGDGGKWTAYSKELSAKITKAMLADKEKVDLNVGTSTKLQVLLDKMVQRNCATGWERRIRCFVVDGSNCYTWQWIDENGKWNQYLPKTAFLLEKERKNGGTSVEFVARKRKYVVDLAKMEQQNKATSAIRKVERALNGTSSADAPVATAKTAAAASTTTTSATTAATTAGETSGSIATRSSAKSGVKRKSGRAAAADDDDSDDEDLTAKKAKFSSGKGARKSGKSGNGVNQEAKDTVKTVVVKGRAPVDPDCDACSTHHVYCEGADVYDAMLNQTNVGNNNNKFYLIQLLEDDNRKQFCVWFRWGRVGFKGQSTMTRCGPDLDQAKKLFCQKFADKTKNDWSERKKFKKVAGKYDMVALDYSTKEKPEEAKSETKLAVPESKLIKEIQELIKLICDIKEMEDAIIEMKYDTKKAPLGRLTAEQIKAGYSSLKKIDQLIEKNDFGQKLVEACNDFYTRIPHDFRMSRPPVIRTKEDVKEKMKLLEALSDIEIAMRILQETKSTENPVDTQYKSLRCDLQLMDKVDPTYKIIEDYLLNTHAPIHNQYKMKMLNVFCIDRNGESRRFKNVGSRMLLWHGSRLTNMVGIMSQGLRVAPPEAPVTGYMFGKGIYFADMSSKSANYCFATKSRNVGLLLLCEVSLGQGNDLLLADYNASELPKGKHSVKGLGKIAPDHTKNVPLPDGTIVPIGKPVDTGISNSAGYTLNYNEFIVYDAAQVKMRYLVQVQFDFS